MHRMTTGAFVLFVVLCLTLTILSGKRRTSVMEDVPLAAPVDASEATDTSEPVFGAATDEETTPADEPVTEEPVDESVPEGEGN